jgi:hypothetical protein
VSVPNILNNSKFKIGKSKTTRMHVMETNKLLWQRKERRKDIERKGELISKMQEGKRGKHIFGMAG